MNEQAGPSKACPGCGCEQYRRIYRRDNFAVPLGPFEPPERLTIRYPICKCEACQSEWRNRETYDVVSKAIADFVTRKVMEMGESASKVRRRERQSWITSGVVVGTFFANAVHLLLQKNWILGGIFGAIALGLFFMTYGGDVFFNAISRKRAAKKSNTVDDDAIGKLFNNAEATDDNG